MKRDFLHITDYTKDEFWDFIEKSTWIKNQLKTDSSYKPGLVSSFQRRL